MRGRSLGPPVESFRRQRESRSENALPTQISSSSLIFLTSFLFSVRFRPSLRDEGRSRLIFLPERESPTRFFHITGHFVATASFFFGCCLRKIRGLASPIHLSP